MYFTSGAKVRTRRSRSLRSPVALYCCQSASVSSADMRRAVAVFMVDVVSCGGRGREELHLLSAIGPPPLKPSRTDLGQMSRASTPQKWGWPQPPARGLQTRGTLQQVASVFVAVATEGLTILDEQPSEPLLLNLTGIALYELGALAGAKALFQAAHRLDPDLAHVKRNLGEIARRRRDGVVPR